MLCGPGGEWKDAVRLHEDSNFIRFYIKRALRSRFSSDFGCDFDTVFDSDDGRKYLTETVLALILGRDTVLLQNAPTLVATKSCPVATEAHSGCNLFTSGCN
jgi:hypothetical protein